MDVDEAFREVRAQMTGFYELAGQIAALDLEDSSLRFGPSFAQGLGPLDRKKDWLWRIVEYSDEAQMGAIMSLISRDLSEPYSIYTYRYFIHNWPQLCFLVTSSLSSPSV